MVYSAFSPSVLGMMSQSFALNTIGANIANVNTGGFKGRDARFSSLVSESLYHESDLGGVRPWEFQRVDQQGLLAASESPYDLGINGRGFFVLSDSFDGNGHIYYGRDGAFQMRTVNDVSVTADDGSTITVRDGYLADKNGYFVLGWEPAADGTFPSSGGSLVPLRIDPYAFSEVFVPTTEAVLGLNLPAAAATNRTETYSANIVDSNGDLQTVTYSFLKSHVTNQWIVVPKTSGTATQQVDTVTLSGTPEVGDRYTVTINGASYSHTVQATQVDTVTLSGTVEVGDTYTITIDGTPFTHAAIAGDTLTTIRDDLLGQIASSGLPVTAAASGTDGLTVTADTAGTTFALVANAVNGGATPDNAVAASTASVTETLAAVRDDLTRQINAVQEDTVNLSLSGTVEAGDVYTVTIDGSSVSYTAVGGDTLADVRDALVSQINTTFGTTVTASTNGTSGITVTANTAGTPFVLSTSTTDGGGTTDNLITVEGVTVTAVATGTDGITVTAKTPGDPFALTASATDVGGTADNAATTTTTAIVLTFNADGTLASPANATMTMAFAGGGTATVDIDLTDMTQYAGELTPNNYSRNGFAAANMAGFRFEENGDVTGIFEDGSTRVLYKVPLAIFSNPNGLLEKNGNVWTTTTESGEADVVAAFSLGAGSFMPNSRELSNVDIAEEFSLMIMTQNAYNSSAQVFKTIDEMVQVARDLKR